MNYKHIVIPGKIIRPFLRMFDNLRSLADLIARFWVAYIFFTSAMSKITDWGATIVLFKYEYTVPILSPAIAAYIGTGLEFILPVFLVLGLGGRFLIFAFFIYNLICVISFQFLWTPAGATGLADHVNWGLLLLLLMVNGAGKYSLDYLIHKRYGFLFKLGEPKQYSWDK